jgi:hypothetical protein
MKKRQVTSLRKMLVKIIPVFLFLSYPVSAQELLVHNSGMGFNVGVNFAVGTHFQRFGINLHFYYTRDFFQLNSELRAYYNLKSLGPKRSYPELLLAQGLTFGFGKQQDLFNPFLSSVSNQTGYRNCVAYSYNAWFNKQRTTQQTGVIAFQAGDFSLITENDIFARPLLDRFRTAACLLQYQYKDILQAAVSCSMWTGSMGQRREIRRPEFHYECYMDTTGGVYANTSHGLLSAQIKYNIGYCQNLQLNAGIDAEQVRNAVQNKFIHDLRFIPKKWNKAKNCHIPMLDSNDQPYLYGENQKIRKPRLFLNLYSDASLFY